jgi:alanine racemase
MHRVGVAPAEALNLARYIQSFDSLAIEGIYTHFAVADEPSHPANAEQLSLFQNVLAQFKDAGIEMPMVHAANSAAALVNPDARFNMVRLGIAMYGLLPGPGVAEHCEGLIPALSLKGRVSAVRLVEKGEAVSYGLRRPLADTSVIATVPIGYADGVPRSLTDSDIQVLVNGVPRPIAGTITMDQLMLDCGNDFDVTVGDEVVLIGRQGDQVVTADEWANALGTIGYEIVCGIGERVFRRYQ